MDLKILNKAFEVIAIVDSYQSIMWCKRYNEIGAIDLQVLASQENIKIFQEGNFIVRDDDDSVFRIEAIEIDTSSEESNYMIIGGVEIKKILHQRIVYETEKYKNETVENVMRDMVNNNLINPNDSLRKINNFYLKEPKGLSDTINTQITYTNVGEKIESLCKTYNYGYKVTLENQNLYFDIFEGKDRTVNQSKNPRVIFSAEYDNLFSSKYNFDKTEFKNVALVGGEGEGSARKKREIGTAEGLDRFEIFVDASGVSSENGAVSDSEYYNLLFEQGKEALTETNVTTSFEAIVDTSFYEYKKDFDLGDVVTITNEYGIRTNARITEIIETWDENGYALEPKFDYIEVFELGENDVIATEAGVMMLSERGIALLNENSPSTEGVKISELEPVDELYNGCCFPIVQNGETKKVDFETLANSTIPVGTILPFVGSTAPSNYLICNGATYSSSVYPELYKILGTTTLPDLKGKFLQGAINNLNQNIEAGLPNITGKFGRVSKYRGEDFYQNSALYKVSSFHAGGWSSGGGEDFNIIGFDASKSNAIYGNSETVQPPAYTVNYIIKAK